MDLTTQLKQLAHRARQASRALAILSNEQKNNILDAMADRLLSAEATILTANQADLARAKAANVSEALCDRLQLTPDRIKAMAEGIRAITHLPDPVGTVLQETHKENGLVIQKVRVPLGVIAIIYESRPNVTADVAALCLKSGNAVILRGGSDALASNCAIAEALIAGAEQAGMPSGAIQLVENTEHEAVTILAQLQDDIDVIIPRGGERLIEAVVSVATVPVIKHYKGLCHTYVHASADQDKALAICVNAKCQRPGVCNAMETLLIDDAIAPTFLPRVIAALRAANVELRGDEKACAISADVKPATDADWDTEYLDLILSIKIVSGVDAAMDHINQHGSHHSDAIIAEDKTAQQYFLDQVDSAAVYVNASTRFTDGGEFGMGAEMGISTDKLHARGPMGLEELCSYKYRIMGDGQVRT